MSLDIIIILKVVKFAFKLLILYVLLAFSKYCIFTVKLKNVKPEIFMEYHVVVYGILLQGKNQLTVRKLNHKQEW